MSDRSQTEGVASIRELRPAEDLALLHTYELRRVFETKTVQHLGLVETGAPESFRPISAPLVIEPVGEPASVPAEPVHARAPESPGPAEAVEVHREEPATEAAAAVPPPRRDWLLEPEPQVTAADPQPYGDDPVRMRELVQWFADGRAATAIVQAPRAAGDLLDAVPDERERPFRLQAVEAGDRIAR